LFYTLVFGGVSLSPFLLKTTGYGRLGDTLLVGEEGPTLPARRVSDLGLELEVRVLLPSLADGRVSSGPDDAEGKGGRGGGRESLGGGAGSST